MAPLVQVFPSRIIKLKHKDFGITWYRFKSTGLYPEFLNAKLLIKPIRFCRVGFAGGIPYSVWVSPQILKLKTLTNNLYSCFLRVKYKSQSHCSTTVQCSCFPKSGCIRFRGSFFGSFFEKQKRTIKLKDPG